MGEGAALMVLERADDARMRGAVPRALLAGAGATTDAHHPTSPHPSGAVARAAVEAALRDAGWRAEDVEHVNAHGTSTPLGDATEAALIGQVYPHRPPVTAPKGVLGHCMGAAGAIEAGLTILTLQHGVVPPIANLDAPATRVRHRLRHQGASPAAAPPRSQPFLRVRRPQRRDRPPAPVGRAVPAVRGRHRGTRRRDRRGPAALPGAAPAACRCSTDGGAPSGCG